MGFRGLKWDMIRTQFQQGVRRWGVPDVLLLHAGGNDIGSFPMRNLIKCMKQDMLCFWDAYPRLLLIWSEIIQRKKWRGAVSRSALNRARVKINKAVSKFVRLNGGLVVRHCVLEGLEYIGTDGVHLTDVGRDIFNFGLAEALECGLRVWRGMQP